MEEVQSSSVDSLRLRNAVPPVSSHANGSGGAAGWGSLAASSALLPARLECCDEVASGSVEAMIALLLFSLSHERTKK